MLGRKSGVPRSASPSSPADVCGAVCRGARLLLDGLSALGTLVTLSRLVMARAAWRPTWQPTWLASWLAPWLVERLASWLAPHVR